MTFLIAHEILLGVNAALLRARYTEFQGTCPQNSNVQSQECKDSVAANSSPISTGTGTEDFSGTQLRYASDSSASAYIDYQKAFGGVRFSTRIDAKYSDDYNAGPDKDPTTLQEAFVQYNANFGVAGLDGTWSISLSVQNLTSERTSTFSGQSFLVPGQYYSNTDAPRTYTISTRFAF